MDVVFDRVAGLDVGKASVMVCVRACASRARAGPGPHLRSTLHEDPPDLAYVSTGTIPVWLLGARLARAPVLCHVHGAEEGHHRLVSLALAAPLALADRVVANSRAAAEPTARRHTPGSRGSSCWSAVSRRARGSMLPSTRWPPMAEGRDVHQSVCGLRLPGCEWYEQDLRDRAGWADVAGHVELLGYVHPTRDLLDAADVVPVPSRTEPFGNTAVGGTGLLVPAGDTGALAGAVGHLLDDPDLRSRLSELGYADAVQRFSTDRYAEALRPELEVAAHRAPAEGSPARWIAPWAGLGTVFPVLRRCSSARTRRGVQGGRSPCTDRS
ncbi:MAG TPA: hypothetical protein VIK12_03190 [Pengzhenrongella sp.]